MILDFRYTSKGWVIDTMASPRAVLPVSVPVTAAQLEEWANTDPAHVNKVSDPTPKRQSFEEFVNSPEEVAYREKRATEWKAWKAQHPNASPYHFGEVGKFGL